MISILDPTDSQVVRLIKLATEISIDYSTINHDEIKVDTTNKKITIFTTNETSTKYLNMLDNASSAKILSLSDLNITNEEVINLLDKLLLIDSNCLISVDLLGNYFNEIPLDKVTSLLKKHKDLTKFTIGKRVAKYKEIENLIKENLITQLETLMNPDKKNEAPCLNYYL